MAPLEDLTQVRAAGRGAGSKPMIRRLILAALFALVAGPAFTVHRSVGLDLPASPTGAAVVAGAAVISLEPLLPSGFF